MTTNRALTFLRLQHAKVKGGRLQLPSLLFCFSLHNNQNMLKLDKNLHRGEMNGRSGEK